MSATASLMAETARRVEDELGRLLPAVAAPAPRLAEAMRYAVLGGGKRLRAVLVRAGHAAAGGAGEAWLRPACAIELLHAYSLIHDDLPAMDDSPLRRGRPSCHVAFDEALAILAGDALQALAFEVLLRGDWAADAATRLVLAERLALAAGTQGMCAGQVLDLEGEKAALDLVGLERMEALKTGALIACALESGAVVAGADEVARRAMQGFGLELGLAFQIRDDVLDAVGDPSLTGKPQGADEAAGKTTFVSLLGIAEAERRMRALRDNALGRLDFLGSRATVLQGLFDFVIDRDR